MQLLQKLKQEMELKNKLKNLNFSAKEMKEIFTVWENLYYLIEE